LHATDDLGGLHWEQKPGHPVIQAFLMLSIITIKNW